jgi:hypothetical protein
VAERAERTTEAAVRPVAALECLGWASLLLMLILASPGVRIEAVAGPAPVAARADR